jgi:hypothetical protein
MCFRISAVTPKLTSIVHVGLKIQSAVENCYGMHTRVEPDVRDNGSITNSRYGSRVITRRGGSTRNDRFAWLHQLTDSCHGAPILNQRPH